MSIILFINMKNVKLSIRDQVAEVYPSIFKRGCFLKEKN